MDIVLMTINGILEDLLVQGSIVVYAVVLSYGVNNLYK
jgi:uncharacterized membrane protein